MNSVQDHQSGLKEEVLNRTKRVPMDPKTNMKTTLLPIANDYRDNIRLTMFRSSDNMIKESDISLINPIANLTTTINISEPVYEDSDIMIIKFEDIRTNKYDAKIALYHWSCLIDQELPTDTKDDRYLSMFIGLTINVLATDQINTFTRLLKDKGRNVKIMTMQESDLTNFLSAVPAYKECMAMIEDYDSNTTFALSTIINCMIMVLLGKQINPNTSNDYFYKRYRAFAVAAQSPSMAKQMETLAFLPDKQCCSEAYMTISGAHSIRRTIFEIIRSYVAGARGRYLEPLKVVLGYLAYTEMTHIDLINTYILRCYPEILSLRCLLSYQDKLSEAFSYLDGLNIGDRVYAKLLFSQQETHVLHRSHFELLTTAAKVVAAFTNKSYINYQGCDEDMEAKVKGSIITYLNARLDHGGTMSIASSNHAAFSEGEKKLVLNRILCSGDNEVEATFTRN